MLDKTDQPTLADFVEKGSNIRVKNEVHLLVGDPDRQCVQRIMLAALRPEAIAEPEELFLVDAVQHRNGCCPCADDGARLRADVDRYSFTVRDLHALPLAGLPAHSENLHNSGSGQTLFESVLQSEIRPVRSRDL
jgi:hypothetical protein